MRPELMVSNESCINCGVCKHVYKYEFCVACGACVVACPLHLRHIAGRELTSKELAEEIRKKSSYYEKYGCICQVKVDTKNP